MSENTPEQETPAPLPAEPHTDDRAGVASAPVKPKKKKKKKGPQQQATRALPEAAHASSAASHTLPATPSPEEDYSPAGSHTASPVELLTLPVKPDEWFIQPATHDQEGNLLTEETLTFFHHGVEILTIPFNGDNLSALTEILMERFAPEAADTEADYFHVRKPLMGEEDSLPVMTLTQRNRILATTTLDQKTLKKLIRALQSHVITRSPVTSWLNRWWHKHKIMRVILIILALPVVALLLYTGAWGMGH